jgi:hypothetical protein
MTSKRRPLFQRILLGIIGAALLAGLVVYSEGAVMIYVHEKRPEGRRIWVPVPALLVSVALRFVPEEKLRDASREVRPWLPAIEAAGEELGRCPDSLLVEVNDPTDHVTVAKGGDMLLIDVDSETDTVRVSVPISLLASFAQSLETSGAPL